MLVIGFGSRSLYVSVSGQSSGRQFYVAPDGKSGNTGSELQPLDLATALSATSPARPGDTIWLRGGTYRGSFRSYLTGTAAAPILVRQYPGERAIIDNSPLQTEGLLAYGAYTWFWGFEIMGSDPVRTSAQTGSWPSDMKRGGGVTSRGRALKFINLIVHDTIGAFGVWSDSVDSEVYGSIIYYNGWQAPDRAHGHGIYTQNQSGNQRLADNILFNQFSHGLHSYGSDAAYLNEITMEGNISFNNGSVGKDGLTRDILLGGGSVAQNPEVIDNSTYGGQVNVGYAGGCSNATVTGNYFAATAVLLVKCSGLVRGNTMYSIYGLANLPTSYPDNTFYGTTPKGTWVRVRRNQYEPGRANIAIYNWESRPTVSVDLLQAGLTVGQAFEIRDAQDFFGTPVLAGVFDGTPVALPMGRTTITAPVGTLPVAPRHTGPRFGAFVVLPRNPGSGTTLPTASLSASPTSIVSGASATLSWSTLNATQVTLTPGGVVAANGSMIVKPTQTTTYTLTATSASGLSVTRSATVTVTSSSTNRPPSVILTSPATGTRVVAPTAVTLAATATDADGTIARVAFYSNGTLLGTDATAPYTWSWNASTAGSYALTAVATDNNGATGTSPTVQITVTTGTGSNATASFVRVDTTTRGSWQGVYGKLGYTVVNDSARWPSFASLAPAGHSPFTWTASTTDVRGLQKVGVVGRIAATWFSAAGTFTVDVWSTDGLVHQLALYMLDWDRGGRAQTIEITNPDTGALLDRRSVTNFTEGQYFVWRVSGRVRIRFIRNLGPNPVVSGVFLD